MATKGRPPKHPIAIAAQAWGLTLPQLAQDLSIPIASLSAYQAGRPCPRARALTIADYLLVPVDQLGLVIQDHLPVSGALQAYCAHVLADPEVRRRVAAECGVSPRTVARWRLPGNRAPTQDQLQVITAVTGHTHHSFVAPTPTHCPTCGHLIS